MADPDPLSAELDGIRDRSDRAAYRHAEMHGLRDSARDVPRLLAALDAVLKAHRNADGRCAWCRGQDGERQKWPCGEYLTITRALTGEGGTDG